MPIPKSNLICVLIVSLLVNSAAARKNSKNKSKATVGEQSASTSTGNPRQNDPNSALHAKKAAESENEKLKGQLREMQEQLTKLEQNQHKQQQSIEGMAEQISKLGGEIDEGLLTLYKGLGIRMDMQQNHLQQNIDQLFYNVRSNLALIYNGLTIDNQWDADTLEKKLTLEGEGPNQLVVHDGRMHGFLSVFGKFPVPRKGIFYFEVENVNDFQAFIAIGLATKQVPLDARVAYYDGENTKLHSHNAYEYTYSSVPGLSGAIVMFKDYLPQLAPKEVIGCGVNWTARKIIYTKNGKNIAKLDLNVNSIGGDLFPCVTLYWDSSKVQANFGPTFKYKIANEK